VRVLPPNDVVLQKSKRARPFVVHKDKVKLFCGEAQASWLKDSRVPAELRKETEQACDESDVQEEQVGDGHSTLDEVPDGVNEPEADTEVHVCEDVEVSITAADRSDGGGQLADRQPAGTGSALQSVEYRETDADQPSLARNEWSNGDMSEENKRPKRRTRKPSRLRDYIC